VQRPHPLAVQAHVLAEAARDEHPQPPRLEVANGPGVGLNVPGGEALVRVVEHREEAAGQAEGGEG